MKWRSLSTLYIHIIMILDSQCYIKVWITGTINHVSFINHNAHGYSVILKYYRINKWTYIVANYFSLQFIKSCVYLN